MHKKILLFIPIIILIISTAFTKNSTKKLDKQIFEIQEDIRALNDIYELVLFDYNYLTSPNKLMEYSQIYFERELKKSNERIDLAHRIDRSTSGLIIITKNLNALRSINKSFLNHEISKKYFLVVNGLWNYKAGIKKMEIKT